MRKRIAKAWPFVKKSTYSALLHEYADLDDRYWRQHSRIARADSRYKKILEEERIAMKQEDAITTIAKDIEDKLLKPVITESK